MNDKIENLEIINLSNYTGYGIFNNKKCFVEGSVIGDIVDVKIEKENKNFYSGKIINFIKKSRNRVEPFCEYFGKCGGCDLQYLNDNYYYEIKLNDLYNHLLKNSYKIEKNDIEIFKTKKFSRRRINLKYSAGKYGFFKHSSNNIVEFNDCCIIKPEIQEIINLFRNIRLSNLNSIDITSVDNGITINLIFNDSPNIKDFEKLKYIKEKVILITYSLNNEEIFFTIFKAKDPIIILDGKEIIIPEKCFLQATKESQDFMIDVVKKYSEKYKNIADLYCGIGTYSYPICENAKVFSYEGNKTMIDNFKKNKSNIQAKLRDLFNQPLINNELNNFDLVVIDPPRNGAGNQIKYLNSSNVKRIIYISCSIEALMRDLKLLKEYTIKKVFLVDQFYMTTHLETIVILDKIKERKKIF